MENPHAERQAVLLERIVKNVRQCIETNFELNFCLEEIIKADGDIKTVASLVTKYCKNVQYNLRATQGRQDSSLDYDATADVRLKQ